MIEGRTATPIGVRFVRPTGDIARARVSVTVVRDDDGLPIHSIAHIEDVTEQRSLRDRLETAATHDPLTGVLNRSGFVRRFDELGVDPVRTGGRMGGDEFVVLAVGLPDRAAGGSLTDLLATADAAAYRAKTAGGDAVRVAGGLSASVR